MNGDFNCAQACNPGTVEAKMFNDVTNETLGSFLVPRNKPVLVPGKPGSMKLSCGGPGPSGDEDLLTFTPIINAGAGAMITVNVGGYIEITNIVDNNTHKSVFQ